MSDLIVHSLTDNSFGVYVHIPFCQRKCPYCDFNSYSTTAADLTSKESWYVNALIKELEVRTRELNIVGRSCRSIFFGGGTPSLFSPSSIERILKGIFSVFRVDATAEITMEVNPLSIVEDLSTQKLSNYLTAGVNRISIGAQSFSIDKLKFLGRWHSPEDTARTFEITRNAGFENINLDLMFGVKGESLLQWESDLDRAIALGPEHISAYMLTMEPGTDFGKRAKKGEVFIVGEDDFFNFYRLTQSKLADKNYLQYEVSNFSVNNKECRHNLNYWYGGEYLALGAGAHGFIKSAVDCGLRWSNAPSPENYAKRVLESGNAVQRRDPVGSIELILEYISFGLRLTEGICFEDKNDFRANAVRNLMVKGLLNNLAQQGLIKINKSYICVPSDKFNLVDGISSEICSLIDE